MSDQESSAPLPLERLGHTPGLSDLPAHTPGVHKGEQWVRMFGRERGRRKGHGRAARDSTSVNPRARNPIDPKMPQLPPA